MEHRVCLCILIVVCTMAFMAVMLICRRRRTARQTVGKETYFVSYSPVYVGLVAGGLLFWLCLTIAVILLEEVDLVTTIILSLFIIFNLLGEFCILFCEIEIHEDKGELVYYHPPFHSIHIWISDITKIQFLENRLNSLEHYRIRIYRKGYKPFDITDDMHNFYRLAEYLRGKENDDVYGTRGYRAYEVEQGYFLQGRIETATCKDDFSVTGPVSDKVRTGVFIFLCLSGYILLVLYRREWSRGEPYYNCYVIGTGILALMGMTQFLRQRLRKIFVRNHTIYVRSSIGRIRDYHIREISCIIEKGNYIMLYAGERRIAKVHKDSLNFISFVEWLKREREQFFESEREMERANGE